LPACPHRRYKNAVKQTSNLKGKTRNVKSRYPALQLVIKVIKILAILITLAGIIASTTIMAGDGLIHIDSATAFSVFAGMLGILASLLQGILIYATAELLQCFIDIERNTRKTTHLLNTR
jgi:hypothetical protein